MPCPPAQALPPLRTPRRLQHSSRLQRFWPPLGIRPAVFKGKMELRKEPFLEKKKKTIHWRPKTKEKVVLVKIPHIRVQRYANCSIA